MAQAQLRHRRCPVHRNRKSSALPVHLRRRGAGQTGPRQLRPSLLVPSSPATTPALAGDEVGALAFGAGGNDVWGGSKAGFLYTSAGAALAAPPASTGLTPRPLPVAGQVNAIVAHPQNVNVVAVAITVGGGTGHVYLSHDGGQHWALIDGGGSSLPPGPILCVAFDPGKTQVTFAGTMAGGWVARNLPAPQVPPNLC